MRASSTHRWAGIVAIALFFALLMQVPHLVYQSDARYLGIPLKFNSDEELYISRVEEALVGNPSQTDEAFLGKPGLHSSQPAMLEQIVGMLFRGSGLDAAGVLRVVDSLSVFAIFLLLFWFFRLNKFSYLSSLIATSAFCVIELYNLQRPIHQGLSILLLLLALNFLIAGMERWKWWGVLGGAFLGLLFGDYFWSWSVGALWVALLILFVLLECVWIGFGDARMRKFIRLLFYCALGVCVSAPFVWQLAMLFHNPLYADTSFRSSLYPSHLPESFAYSILFAAMSCAVLWESCTNLERISKHRYAVVTILAGFIALNQQVIHGIVLNFAAHYILILAIAALSMILLAWKLRTPMLVLGAAAACVYLAGLAWDGRYVVNQFHVIDRFQEQYFATLVPVLDALPRSTIVSDPSTSMLVAEISRHDVVYGLYLKNTLLSNEELAERYCVSVAALPPADRQLEAQPLLWPDADAVFKDPALRAREVEMVRSACVQVDRDPVKWLDHFGVQYVLWDEKRKPQWKLARLKARLTLVEKGDGWSLWKIPAAKIQNPR